MKYITLYFLLFGCMICVHSCSNDEPIPSQGIAPEEALQNYVDAADETYNWEFKSTYNVAGVNAHDIELTSQQWRDYTWKHHLTILTPHDLKRSGALLWITGGKNIQGDPLWVEENDAETFIMSLLANSNSAVVAILRQVPNQPLFQNLSEDALIAHTLNQYREDKDYTWPLLFPMVKSAVSAMDAVQAFIEEGYNLEIKEFVVSGASKRGWTSWLTGAIDERVTAIAPAVIDIVNMPVNLSYQLETWGDYSVQIQDYVNLGIAQDIQSENGIELATMIDPFSYRKVLTMPKLIFIGTNDPYWPVDAVKHYLAEMPGENFLHYVANAGHDLGNGEDAMLALNAFLDQTFSQNPYSKCSWEVVSEGEDIRIDILTSSEQLSDAFLWTAVSDDRDFRDETWMPTSLKTGGVSKIEMAVPYPEKGFKAFYVDLQYLDTRGINYTKSTRMFVCNTDKLFLD